MKKVYSINPDLPFLDTLAAELWRQTGGDGFRLSKYLILLPTRRACRHLGAAFAHIASGKPALLPRMRPLGDVDEEEMTFFDSTSFNIPPAISPLKRLMLLTQQVKGRDPTLSWDQATLAATALANFLDQIQVEQCDISQLPHLVEEQELAEHWQLTLTFLDIVTKNWPLILAEQGCIDPVQRRNAIMAAQTKLWHEHPPAFPVIAAGSTGSMLATADMLNIISTLPEGAVILPGLDREIDHDAWDAIDETHPQYTMKKLLAKMEVERKAVKDFSTTPSLLAPRIKLLSESMRPAGLTDTWRGLRGVLDKTAHHGLTSVTLDHQQEEAQVIALRLRAVLETAHQTAILVTADRQLAARVASLLERWGIKINDSGGLALASLPIGSFLSLALAAADPHAEAIDFLALLKHPLSCCGLTPASCRAAARVMEIHARNTENEDFSLLKDFLKPLTESWDYPLPLTERITKHIAVTEAIATSNSDLGSQRLWQDESGKDAAEWLDEWRQGAEDFPMISGDDYAALFTSLLMTKIIRSAHATNPRLSILGPLEARLISADLIILGGMNEGVWPPETGFDPWMSRTMRKKFDLATPEFRIGLSAHDFTHLACAHEVMLTRAVRYDGAPAVPSRFLLQIEAVLGAAGLSDKEHDALQSPQPWRDWAAALDAPRSEDIKPCLRPQPRPPISARPVTLSVTEIGTWLRNPYAIYAKHILRLKKLEELDTALDAADRGTMIHNALEEFAHTFPDILPTDATARLLAIGQNIFAPHQNNPRVRAFWWARFVSIAGWFVDQERARRAANIRLLGVEAKGARSIGHFILTGRADRIDRLADGTLAIIDYKTGAIPTKTDVISGIDPQLSLLAFIAEAGGFSHIPAAQSSRMEYWSLQGNRSDCKIISFDQDIPDLIKNAEIGLKNLLIAFANPDTAYEATPRPRLRPRHDDYVHLSRQAEWNRISEVM